MVAVWDDLVPQYVVKRLVYSGKVDDAQLWKEILVTTIGDRLNDMVGGFQEIQNQQVKLQ